MEIKKCPHCQSENVELKSQRRTYGHGDYPSVYWIECEECGMRTIELADGYDGTQQEIRQKLRNIFWQNHEK